MRLYRFTLPVAAAAVAVAAVPALATTAATPAAGRATSTVTLLSTSIGSTSLQALQAALASSSLTSTSPTASVSLTPLLKDGAAVVPAVTVTQDTQNQPSVASHSTSVAGVLGVTSPAATVQAVRTATGAMAKVGVSTASGLVTLLGAPVKGSVALSALSNVAGSAATSSKDLTVTGLALPSVLDLLKGAGLDLSALPTDTLLTLAQKLNLLTPSLTATVDQLNTQITSIQNQINSQQSSLTAALAKVDQAKATLAAATSQLTTDQASLATAQQQLNGVVTQIDTLANQTLSASQIQAQESTLSLIAGMPALLSTFNTDYQNVQTLTTDVTTDQSTVQTATDALNAANTLVTQIEQTLASLASQLDNLLAALRSPLTALLDGTPLLSIGSIDVHTLAAAGAQHVAQVTGTVTGLHVMGTDVLKAVTGSSTLNLVNLAGSTLSGVTSAVQGVLGRVSSVLSSVASLPDLKVPAPTVALLTKTTSLAPIDGLAGAQDTVTALKLNWAGITIPAAATLPGVNLPQVQRAQATITAVPAVSLAVGQLADLAQSRPATAAPASSTPATSTPSGTTSSATLPHTGLDTWIPVTALVLLGCALIVRRRFARAD